MYQNTSQRVNVETCSANSMKTYKYKQKQINYKGAKKAQGKQTTASAKHPNKTTTINYKAHENTGIKHIKKYMQAQRKQLTTSKKKQSRQRKTSKNAKKSKRKKNEEEEEEEE